MDIHENYKPIKFGKEYVDINGSYQYPMFAATALGIKPSYDDWINISDIDKFTDVCQKYGLFVEKDVIFQDPKNNKDEVVGGSNITTTYAQAVRYSNKIREGKVHVFVSKSREIALLARKFGWYSAVIGKRSSNKPFIDHLRFGHYLGFPDCCINFFREFNNWKLYSHPHEIYKNTKNAPSIFCNNFLMDNTYFLIHHLPCSYNCGATIALAKKTRTAIQKVEPGFALAADNWLRKPLLVFGERHFIIFEGSMDGSIIKYNDCQYISNPARPEEKISFYDGILAGDSIVDAGEFLEIRKGNGVRATIKKNEEWFLIAYG